MREIKLTKGFSTWVDDEDFERVSQFKWYAHVCGRGTKVYAVRNIRENGKQVNYRMHRFVLGLPARSLDGLVVDHLNGDGLDNRKANLEIITQTENMNRVDTWKRGVKVKSEEPCL